MSTNFQRTTDLPQYNVTRAMLYELLETMIPLVGVTDDASLTVLNEKLQTTLAVPRWRKYTVTYEDIAVAAGSTNVELFTLPGGGVIHAVKLKHSEAFAGGTISALTVSVGVAAELDRYATAFDVFQAIGDTVFAVSDTVGGESFDAAGTSIRLGAAATGDDLDAATAGSVDVWVLWSATED
jgi:hypothetical protein